MAAEAEGFVETLQRAVIGRQRLLVQADESEEKQLHVEPTHGTLAHRMPPVTPQDILLFLSIVVAIMLVIVLYHVMFIVVDLRKIARRLEDVTAEVEAVILKPISMADQIFQWILEKIESKKRRKRE